jgi:predicted TIM-barrel enzyme
MSLRIFASQPLVIAALHLPDFAMHRDKSMAWFEDYALSNARVFAEAGVPWVKVQDQTGAEGPAVPDTLTMTAALARLVKREFPSLGLGIIVEAHDPAAALSVAHAAGADFARLKVFVGGAMTARGPRHGLGGAAVAYRAALGRPDIAILADVHDRTAVPLSSETQPFAAQWAVKTGADGLIITGASFPDTLSRIAAVREAGVGRPILIGGGVTETNVAKALSAAEGVIVSSSLMRRDAAPDEVVRWDVDACRRFMDAADAARADPA